MLNVTVEDLNPSVILHCVGRIVRGEETAILCAAAHRYGRDIVLDLSKVDAIDAAGVGVLLALQAAGIYLRLANPMKPVRQVLEVTKLTSIFEISESETSRFMDAPLIPSVISGESGDWAGKITS